MVRTSFCFLLIFFYLFGNAASANGPFNERLRYRLELLPQLNAEQGLTLINPEALRYLYSSVAFQPLWMDSEGRINAKGKVLVSEIHSAPEHGLEPQDYHAGLIDTLLSDQQGDKWGSAVDLELLLTDALILYGFHTKHGKVNPDTLQVKWVVNKEYVDELQQQLVNAEFDLASWLASLRPKTKAYEILRAELAKLRQKPPETLGLSETLKPGNRHAQVPRLARVMHEFGYLPEEYNDELYSASLKKAVLLFQEEHSLEADGIVGPTTRWAINSLYAGDVDKIRVNMERWRWMPETLGDNFISVNIASFNLRYVFAGEQVLKMKTVVGRSYRKTPVFSGNMRYLVVNPSWSVPHKIASQDLLPKIKADPDFFEKMNMLLFQGWGQDQRSIDPKTVDWTQVSSSKFPYHIRQLPGEKNALGRVKFMFPNEHSVYLHDTNDKSLFQKSARAFSSGCIRLENPLELLELVSKHHAEVAASRVRELLDSGKESTIVLKNQLPVHIQYWTVWVDEDARLHYRNDIYERDAAILKGLSTFNTDQQVAQVLQ